MTKKDKQVGIIEHTSGAKIPLMFNPNDRGDGALTFSASYGDKIWTNKSADDLRREVRTYLDSCSALDWMPVIEISESHSSHSNMSSYVGIDANRLYLACGVELDKNKEYAVRKLSWDDYNASTDSFGYHQELNIDMNRIKRSTRYHVISSSGVDLRAKLPFTKDGYGDRCYVIAYTEEVWSALESIQAGIDGLAAMLRELLGTASGHERLAEAGRNITRMLSPAYQPQKAKLAVDA